MSATTRVPSVSAKDRDLLALEVLLNQNLVSRIAKGPGDQHGIDRVASLGAGVCDDDALARRQPRGIDHHGKANG